MGNVESLSHTLWECKYHLVWIPKCRKKTLYGPLRKYLGSLFKDLASQRECEIIEGHLLPDHVHILISIPPKYAVAQVVGFIKGKSAIHIARPLNFSLFQNSHVINTVGYEECSSENSNYSKVSLPGHIWDIARTSLARAFGPGVTMFPRLARMKKPPRNISSIKKRKIGVLINSVCLKNNHL